MTADDVDKLNEVARAIKHEGDTYFANCKLEAWKIWYCLDNDTNRFAWADSTNGKGVIYRMIDEWDNDVPYDFKGILTKAYVNGSGSLDYRYTFGGAADETVNAGSTCYLNKMGAYFSGYQQVLNQNTFGIECIGNTLGTGCYNNYFFNGCCDNTFGNNCGGNSLEKDCFYNTFGNGCSDNGFEYGCYSNSFGESCKGNDFGDSCFGNTFGCDCSYNYFYEGCIYNYFGCACISNTFGSGCAYNTFGDQSQSNHFGDFCASNTFGSECLGNYLKDGYFYNTFGNGCRDNGLYYDYVWRITLQSGVSGITLTLPSTSYEQPYQNVEIKSGVSNVTITDTNVNQSFHTTYKPVGSMEVSV